VLGVLLALFLCCPPNNDPAPEVLRLFRLKAVTVIVGGLGAAAEYINGANQ
jgi:hypothetical protein